MALEQSHWNSTVCHRALGAAPSPGVCLSHGDGRCSSSAECQAAFALAREAEMPIGSLGRGRNFGGHHFSTLWNGTAGQKAAVSPTSHFICVHQHHDPVEIPLQTDPQPTCLTAHAFLVGISMESKSWHHLMQPTCLNGTLKERFPVTSSNSSDTLSSRLESTDAKKHLYFEKTYELDPKKTYFSALSHHLTQ